MSAYREFTKRRKDLQERLRDEQRAPTFREMDRPEFRTKWADGRLRRA